MRIVQLCCIFVAVLLILFQRIDVKHSNDEPSFLHISFSVLSFSVYIGKKQNKKIKNGIRFLRKLPIYLKAFNFLLSHSDVTVITSENKNITFEGLIRALPIVISAPPTFAYLNNTAKSVKYLKLDKKDEDEDLYSNTFILSASFRSIHLIISALLLLYYNIKNRLRRSKINV